MHILVCFLLVFAPSMTRSATLSLRLNRIYNFSKNSKVVVDVGCDHGWLAIKLASNNERIDRVYCIDNSIFALKNGICQNIQNLDKEAKNKLTIINGDGLTPIIRENKKVETIILAGLGARTINSILDIDLDPLGCSQLIIQVRISCASIDIRYLIGVILQPFPCNLKDVLPLYQSILENHTKWDVSDIAVDYENRQFYLTTVFSLAPGTKKRRETLITLSDLPFHYVQEKSILLKYFKKQQELLTVKRRGLVYDGDDGTPEFQYLLLILKQVEELLTTGQT